jgi:hypothetical protein
MIIIEWPVEITKILNLESSGWRRDVLPDGTRVFAHTWVCFSAYAMGRLPQLWEDPCRCAPPPPSLLQIA